MAIRYLSVILMAAAIALVPTSCIKEKLSNTPHPREAQITVTADWEERGADVPVPKRWAVRIGNKYSAEETDTMHIPDRVFDPGDYRIMVWAQADSITVTDSFARADIVTGYDGAGGTFITGNPGWLFTFVKDTSVIADRDYRIKAVMKQQVRELRLVLRALGDTPERITGIEGYLTGAAGAMCFSTNEYCDESNVRLSFVRDEDEEDEIIWKTSIRLLGITGDSQKFIGKIFFENNNPNPVVFESNLSEDLALAGFNSDKRVPVELTNSIDETPTEGDVSASLGGWEQTDGGNIDVH